MALDPLREEMADQGFRGGAEDIGLLECFPAGDGHQGKLWRKALHMLRLLLHEALRDQQREVNVLMARGLKAIVQLALDDFPNGVAVGLDDHAPLDDFSRLGHVPLQDDILIPGREVFGAGRDWRFCHFSFSLIEFEPGR